MCGILGLIDKNKSISSKKFSSALKLQNSRGPDNTCVKNFHLKNINLFFGHNRLKIIDLSNNANQPMVRDGFTLIFNGEIYNYIELRNKLKKIGFDFITNSDTEVILYSWMHCLWVGKVIHDISFGVNI